MIDAVACLVQDHASDELGIERAEAQDAPRGLAHYREGFLEERIQGLTPRHAPLELDRLRPQLLVREPVQCSGVFGERERGESEGGRGEKEEEGEEGVKTHD